MSNYKCQLRNIFMLRLSNISMSIEYKFRYVIDISSNFRLRTSNLLLGCSWSIYTVGWAKVSWSSTLSNILVGLVTAILLGRMSNILVLGHFPSTTSPAQFPQSQLPQQQFPQPLISPTLTSLVTNFPNSNFPNR